MVAALQHLDGECKFIVKLTGKYMLPGLATVVKRLPDTTLLALASRGHSYGGYSSEVFGVEAQLFKRALAFWADGRNTESFVHRLKDLVEAVNRSRVARMPRMRTVGASCRYTDNRRMAYL